MPPTPRSRSSTPSRERNMRGTSKERKSGQQKLSWAEIAADATHTPTPSRNASPTRGSRYEEEIIALRKQNEDLKRKLEEQEKRARTREGESRKEAGSSHATN
ncbi:hypothetical protein MTO96_040584 [Rhipicephalus appendiculatus]